MRKDIALILLILAILALIVVPLGPVLLDVLLSLNMTLAVLLLIVAVYLKHPADFPTFPTVILLGTAFRLALSIATTRQILSEAEAGQIIETFGSFVIAGNIAIGLIVFLIITVFQFLVITKGAERVAEVGARFTLDALPGKQMAIDADLRAENIDNDTASARRARLQRESQFFGSMDGAMKFVKGDAIAGLIIIFINLIGGASAGMLVHGMDFSTAIETYTLLTLGDGLVAQLPALLMAMCAGIITTRIEGEDNTDLGSDIWRDLVSDPRVPAAAAGIVVLIGLIPGFPLLNFAVAAGLLLAVSFSVRQVLLAEAEEEALAAGVAAEAAGGDQTATGPEGGAAADGEAETPRSRRVVLRIGADLAERLDVERVDSLVKQHFQTYERLRGLLLPAPKLQIAEADPIGGDRFEVLLDEVPLVTETASDGHILLRCEPSFIEVIGAKAEDVRVAKWHEFAGYWVPAAFEEAAAKAEVTPTEIEAHIAQIAFRIVESNIGTLFSHEQLGHFLDQLSENNSQQRQELEQKADNNTFFLTLRYLAEDGVPLRPASLIVDTYLHWIMMEGNIGAMAMAERMRGSLKRQMCHSLSGGKGILGVILLDPAIEEAAAHAISASGGGGGSASSDGLPLDVNTSEEILNQFRHLTAHLPEGEASPCVIASAPIRRRLRNYLSANRISLPVLSPHELSPEIQVHPVARVQLSRPGQR